jgi:hypothetical protein
MFLQTDPPKFEHSKVFVEKVKFEALCRSLFFVLHLLPLPFFKTFSSAFSKNSKFMKTAASEL